MAEEIDVGMKCIKYMLFVSNFMFVMIGFLLISIGSTIKAIYGDFEAFMSEHYFSPATLVVAIGVIIFFVAIFGCVGAIKESTLLINLFAFFLSIILILEISAAIAAYTMRNDLETQIRLKMDWSLEDYGKVKYITQAWDFTQSRLHCCGIDSSMDWSDYVDNSNVTSIGLNETTWFGPNSCCRMNAGFVNDRCTEKYVYKNGCASSLAYIVSECALLLGCGALAVAFIQILGIVFAHMLAKAVRRLKTQQLVERDQPKVYEQLAKGKNENELPQPVLYLSNTTPTFTEA